MTPPLVTDGSAASDARARVVIDRTDDTQRWRYTCPNGHTDFAPTNSHVWCKGCRRQFEAGADVDPEHYYIIDKQTDEEIPWSAVEVVE